MKRKLCAVGGREESHTGTQGGKTLGPESFALRDPHFLLPVQAPLTPVQTSPPTHSVKHSPLIMVHSEQSFSGDLNALFL